RGTSVCLITKDPEEDYEKRIEESKIVFPKQVVGVSRLHKNFTQHEARRHLRDEFDLFVADEAVLPMLSKKLGSKFFEAKKQPIGIKITPSSNIGAAIGQVLSATVMHQTVGDSLAVKIASASWHTPEQVTANVQAALPVIAAKIPGGWKNVLAVGIKTTKSPQLPFYKS
ncbi:ribosomal protein L1, partial [Ramicandelaber brevisporus]